MFVNVGPQDMSLKESAKAQVSELVAKFDRIAKADKLHGYNEAQTKADFIEPLFEAMGWDIANRHHIDEVTREETISRKRVDYGFRINGIPKFYLEAKSFKEGVDDPEYIKQAITYAWNKDCTWAVLTDFAKVRIFNAEVLTDDLAQNHLKTIDCREFFNRFDELWLLSKESFQQGELDKVAETWGKKLQKSRITDQLLSDFTRFREMLSKSVTKLNQRRNITQKELDESMQRILDRLIFVRSCEDRGLEEPHLIPLVRDWAQAQRRSSLVKSLRKVFDEFNNSYDSRIFETHLCDSLEIDDGVLAEIIEGLKYPHGRLVSYDFAHIEADVLGSIYEQYLSYILRKTKKRATLTQDEARRREQGIYYTPKFVVDFMVRSTLGEILRKKGVKPEKIRIVDPACGSGSFLIKAYDIMNEYHANHNKGYAQSKLDELGAYSTKLEILRDNIFGVDLDVQAVEIAQLNLLLKVTEKGKRLPILQENIKRGNSLIDEKSVDPDNAFIWKENFPRITEEGWFDVVVSNPPYISAIQLSKLYGEKPKEYWKKRFAGGAQGAYDIFVLFFMKAFEICKDGGYVCLITPNKYLSSPYGAGLRELIAKNYTLVKVVDLSQVRVFKEASVYPVITIIQKSPPKPEYTIVTQKVFSDSMEDSIQYEVSSRLLTSLPEYIWGVIISNNMKIVEKIFRAGVRLDSVATVQATSTAGEADEYSKLINDKGRGIRIVNTGTIDRYRTTYGLKQLKDKGRSFSTPFLDISKEEVSAERKRLYKHPKILFSKLALRVEAFLDVDGSYASINTNCAHSPKDDYPLEYLIGLLNSSLMSFAYAELFRGLTMSKGYFQFQAPQLRILPVANASKDNRQALITLVREISNLNDRLNALGNKETDEKKNVEQSIAKLDSNIDELVFKIYGLTEEEKNVIRQEFVTA